MNLFTVLLKQAIRISGTIMCIIVAGGISRADAPKAEEHKSSIELRVETIRDMGGLPKPESDDTAVNVRLTTALEKHLGEIAKDRFVLLPHSKKPSNKSQAALSLEGELSHIATATQGGPFLCVLRLFENKPSRRLLGQWAGWARTFRDLSGNVQNDARISPNGLIGELGKRVAAAIAVSEGPSEGFAAFVKASAHGDSPLGVSIVPVDDKKRAPVKPSKTASEGYRVHIASPISGTLYLVAVGDSGMPTMLLDSVKQARLVSTEHPIVVPDASAPPFQIDRKKPEIVVLVRKSVKAMNAATPHATSLKIARLALKPRPDDKDLPADQAGQAVIVLDGGTILPKNHIGDAGVERILQMAAKDPPGTWFAETIKVSAPARPSSLWEKIGQGAIDPNALSLTCTPDKAALTVLEEFHLRATPDREGYLVVLSQKTDGTIETLFPSANNIDAAHVHPGKMIFLPENTKQAYAADRPGKEYVRALLLNNRKDAQAIVAEVNKLKSGSSHRLTLTAPFYLAELHFDIVARPPM